MSYFHTQPLADAITHADVVVFDMNGLIIDDEPIQKQASNEVFAPYNITFSDEDWINHIVGRKPNEWMADFAPDKSDVASLVQQKDAVYERLITHCLKDIIRPGFLSFLAWLDTANMPFALATSTTYNGMDVILGKDGMNIRNHFDFIITGDEVTHAKPHPEIYNKVSDHFGQDKHYIVFEDTPIGAKAAVDAGMQAFAVPNRYTLQKDFPGGVIKIASMQPDTTLIL